MHHLALRALIQKALKCELFFLFESSLCVSCSSAALIQRASSESARMHHLALLASLLLGLKLLVYEAFSGCTTVHHRSSYSIS